MTDNPTIQEIIDLAHDCGYEERRSYVSHTLFFIESAPGTDMPPIRINVYPSTRSIMTLLHHPKQATTNALWRSSAYEDLEDLRSFFIDPRQHTGKGYRNAKHAVRGCVKCGAMKSRTEFSSKQWNKGPDANKCKPCVKAFLEERGQTISAATTDDHSSPPSSLTEAALKQHNRTATGGGTGGKKNKKTKKQQSNNYHNHMERRQFNCPVCPRKGRGNQVFFKRVPAFKPFVKCPQCKLVTQGKCSRIMPVPRDQERGYGLFSCLQCKDTWGSTRAVASVGQECFSCITQGRPGTMVKPFRLEVPRKKSKGYRRRTLPKNVIAEDEPEKGEYTAVDEQRHLSGASEALAKGGIGSSYVFNSDSDSTDAAQLPSDNEQPTKLKTKNPRIPEGYRHKCAGCAQGLCRRRLPPKSHIHDSDGDTNSTRSSIVTNSSVDKTDFVDRDEDFSGFLLENSDDDDRDDDFDNDDEYSGSWVQV